MKTPIVPSEPTCCVCGNPVKPPYPTLIGCLPLCPECADRYAEEVNVVRADERGDMT